MTNNEIITYLAAILTTLAESDGTPESTLYLAVGMDMTKWETVKAILTGESWISIAPSHWVTITDSGRVMADKINAVLA